LLVSAWLSAGPAAPRTATLRVRWYRAVDLQLQRVEVDIPARFAENVPEDLTLNVPPGFFVSVFAAGLGLSNPRFMAFDDNDVLHVANMGRNQIVALPDGDGDGVADRLVVAASGFDLAH